MDNLQKIIMVCEKEDKSLIQLALKTSEEVGELSEAVLSYTNANGCGYKQKTSQDIIEEACDIILCATATAYRVHPDPEIYNILTETIERKIKKWQEKMNK